MTHEEQERRFDMFVSKAKELLFKKGKDYNSNSDKLSGFKTAGAIIGQDAKRSCLNLIATKVARLGQLIGTGKAPNFESIEDTLIDLFNYTFLLENILHDEKAQNPNVITEHLISRMKALTPEDRYSDSTLKRITTPGQKTNL